jgi:hypothetical protein
MATRTPAAKSEKAGPKAAAGAARTARPPAATPWGAADVLEEVSVRQRAEDRRFAVLVQLLETRGGETLVRFAYTTDGVTRRGPVTMRARDFERLRAALERAPVLKEVLGM